MIRLYILKMQQIFVSAGIKPMSWLFIFLSRRAITKHLMTGPMGNNEFCFPVTLNVPLGFVLGNIEGLREQSSLFPLGPES